MFIVGKVTFFFFNVHEFLQVFLSGMYFCTCSICLDAIEVRGRYYALKNATLCMNLHNIMYYMREILCLFA